MKSTSTLSKFLSKIQTFDTLRYYRDFRFLLSSDFLHAVMSWMQMLVMSWLAYEVTGSPFFAALFAAARLAPQLLGPIAGVIADRVNRLKLIMAIRAVETVFAAILAILITLGFLEFWHLAVIGFLQGVIMSAAMTTGSALLMDIVGEKNVTNAIALRVVSWDATRVVGPAIGGTLIALTGPASCFWIAIGVNILSLIILFPIHPPTQIKAAVQESPWRSLVEGFKYVIHSRDMLSVLSVSVSANIFVWPAFQSFMPVFAKDNLGLDAMGLGFLQTASGVGALIGAIYIASLGNFNWKGLMLLGGTALYGAFFGAFAISHSYPLALALIALADLFSSGFGAMQSTLMLILSPEEMRARSIGFLSLAIGALPFGCLAMGVAANVIGAGPTTAISGALMVVTIIAIALGFPNLRRL